MHLELLSLRMKLDFHDGSVLTNLWWTASVPVVQTMGRRDGSLDIVSDDMNMHILEPIRFR